MAEDPVAAHLREQVESTRAEFDFSRKALLEACKIVPDIGLSNPDGKTMWDRATGRYDRALRAYNEALHGLSEFLLESKNH